MKKVSIIIPFYNNKNTIKKCIDSVINQTYKDIEIILINNNSTDKSLDIIKSFKDKRIKLFNAKKQGGASARNVGLNKATGDYITFVDADDYLNNDSIEIMINLMNEYDTDVIRTNYISDIKTYEKKYKEVKYNKYYDKNDINNTLIPELINQKLSSYIWLLLIKKDVIKDIKFNEELYVHHDFDFYVKIFKKIKNIYISDTITYNYSFNKNSSKSNKYLKRNIYNLLDLNSSLIALLPEYKNVINSTTTNMIIPLFKYIYLYNKKEFYEVLNDFKNNDNFKKMYNKNVSKKTRIEYTLLFKLPLVFFKLYVILFKLTSSILSVIF